MLWNLNLHLAPERELLSLVTSKDVLVGRIYFERLEIVFAFLISVSQESRGYKGSHCTLTQTCTQKLELKSILYSPGIAQSPVTQDCNWDLGCILFW